VAVNTSGEPGRTTQPHLRGPAGSLFVAVEGIDHSGKTTLTRALADHLRAAGRRVALVKEPTHEPVGMLLRQLSADPGTPAVALALLSAADRHTAQTALDAALRVNDVVVADRYLLSGLAYHFTDGVDVDLYRACTLGVRLPDLYLYLDVTPTAAASRVARPPDSRWEQPAFAARLPAAYRRALQIVADHPAGDVVHLDAHQPAATVLAAAITAVTDRLPTIHRRNAA